MCACVPVHLCQWARSTWIYRIVGWVFVWTTLHYYLRLANWVSQSIIIIFHVMLYQLEHICDTIYTIRINRRFVRLAHRPPMQTDQSKIDLDLHHTLFQTHKTNTIYNITSPCDAVSFSVSLSALRSLSFCSLYGVHFILVDFAMGIWTMWSHCGDWWL